jgi:hypothetical protein
VNRIAKFISLSFFIFVFFVSSSLAFASEFWGIRVFDPTNIHSPVNIELAQTAFPFAFKKEDKVEYGRYSGATDNSIYCHAIVTDTSITFKIYNESKEPVKLNYFMDEYYAITKDGYKYILKLPDALQYPSGVLNPKNNIEILLQNNTGTTEIQFIMINLPSSDCYIFLRRID